MPFIGIVDLAIGVISTKARATYRENVCSPRDCRVSLTLGVAAKASTVGVCAVAFCDT
jgi:hypothetical protein